MNKSVCIAGPLLSQSGYGVHSRQIAQWAIDELIPLGYDITFAVNGWGMTTNYVNNNILIKKIKENIKPLTSRPDIFIHIALPNEWQNVGKVNIGVTAAVETTKANPEWKKHCNKMSLVIVPSKHAAKSLEAIGVNNYKVKVIPESYIEECVEPAKSIDLNLQTEKNFLIFGQMGIDDPKLDRKNTEMAIRYFIREFKDNKEVGLVVKTNIARFTTIDRERSKNLLKEIVDSERGNSEFPKIYFLHGHMNNKEIVSLYKHKNISALYSCTRGEGFGLPLLEAAVAGLPVVASNWSSHPEFLNLGAWTKIDGQEVTIPKNKVSNYDQSERNIFIEDSKWFEVNEESTRQCLRDVINNLQEKQTHANNLRKILRNEYSLKKIKKIYSNILIKR